MAIDFMDNYSNYNGDASKMLDGVYTEVGAYAFYIVDDPDGVSSGKVLRGSFGNAGQRNVYYPFSTSAQKKAGISTRFWWSYFPTTSDTQAGLGFSAITGSIFNQLAYLTVDPSGRLIAKSHSNWNLFPDTQTLAPVVTTGAWWHVEAMLSLEEGKFEVRVEGRTVLDIDFTPYASGTGSIISLVSLNRGDRGPEAFNKDFVVWNGSGSQNTDFLGTVFVYNMEADSNVTNGSWDITGVTDAYQVFSKNPFEDDNVYMEADVNAVDSTAKVNLSNPITDLSVVKGIMTFARVRKEDSGDAELQMKVNVSGESESLGQTHVLAQSYSYKKDVFDINPETGNAWTLNELENLQFGITRKL